MVTGSNIISSLPLTFLTFSSLLIIRFSCLQIQNILGPKGIGRQNMLLQKLFFPFPYSAWTTLHVTLSEAQRQFPRALQKLASSASPITFYLS